MSWRHRQLPRTPRPYRVVSISLGIAGLLLLLMGSLIPRPQAAGSVGGWTDHPALRQFDLGTTDLPDDLYLVRTRGTLPAPDAARGIMIHGARRGLYLVSGDRRSVMQLVQIGCAVIPLQKPSAGAARSPSAAARTWDRVTTPDPDIAAIVAQVTWTDVSAKIQWLVDFETRYSYAVNHPAVADSVAGVFAGYGLTPMIRPFEYDATTMYNVEATQTGTVYPDSFFIICGHFDSYSERAMRLAPGADDNGTGTAAVLTAAEILTQYDFEYSIRYICFAGEEQGLRGSQDYASWAVQQNLGIVGVLNFDMMGYWEPGVQADLEIETNVASQWLAAAITNAADLYTGAEYQLHVDNGAWWGDHASFWNVGYAAVNHEEAWDWYDPDFNPYYHSTNDLPTYLGDDFTVKNIRVGVAALATLAVLVPYGTGAEPPAAPDVAGSLRAYPNPFSARVTFTVAGLPERSSVRIILYDVLGRRVGVVPVSLYDGRGRMDWTGGNGVSRAVGAGVYFARLEGVRSAAPVKFVHIK